MTTDLTTDVTTDVTSDVTTGQPPDHAARARIAGDLDTTLFVEAGAGAGKTTELVGRVLALVRSGIPVRRIAAITFTEKAAAELRHRLREALDAHSGEGWARTALDDLDHAPIGTLHGFARRLLLDTTIESGLPPGFRVHDEIESNLAFDEGWSDLLGRLLATVAPPGGVVEGGRDLVELCEFDRFGVDTGLFSVVRDFRYNWDLVEQHVDRTAPPELRLDLDVLVDAARAVAATPCPPDDSQADHVVAIGAAGEQLHRADGLRARLEAVEVLRVRASKAARGGNKSRWRIPGVAVLDELKASEDDLAARCGSILEDVRRHRRHVVGVIGARFVLEGAQSRADDGVLDFHDLLVRARQLLASDATVRRRLHEAYERVLLDEFQDTDPIQLEIAVRLTARPDDPAHDDDWRTLRPIPGRLFIVGDPKQSIYRFRRADIAQYLRAADQIGADAVGLVTNFRSTSAVIGFTNAVFARLIDEEADVQPRFNPLSAGRRDALLHHGSVHVVGAESHADLAASREAGRADELRRREAADVVDAIRRAIVDGWRVADDRSDGTRPCTLGDICVLVPTRLSLPALESQLRAAGLAYRAENASIVYSSDEVRSVLMALRAADDPTDELAVVTALRSPLYGCSDVDLYTWRSGGGTWSVWRTPPDGLAGHPVADALAHLDSVRDRIGSHGAAELLSAVIDERRVWDAALDAGDARDVWHRLRFVVDQARAWADAGGHGVRRYLAWARMQATDGRVSEAILPEEDRDTIRIMTIHAAKGLEFPIAIVSGLTTQPQKRTGVSVVWKGSDWFLSGKGDDGSFEEHRPLDEQMGDAERRRLLYVACTRAADHLVVSLHRIRDHGTLAAISPDKMTSAELLAFVGDAGDAAGPLDAPRTAVAPIPPGHTVVDSLPERIAGDTGEETTDDAAHDTGSDIAPDIAERWVTRHRAVVRAAARRRSIAATRLAEEVAAQAARDAVDDPGLDKHPVDIETPAWQRGRYGTSIGRAVHGTLQFCDLVGGADIGTLARSQCAAEGIIGLESQVVALATSAIAAPIVRIAAGGAPHWRELFVVAPVADRVLEGYIDLLVETGDGLVIVDYKTDRWSGPKQSAERIGRYRLQLAAYAVALAGIVDQPIVGGTLVRCVAGREPDQVEIPDWAAALAEVRALVR